MSRKVELEQYFETNRARKNEEKANIFFVRQSGKLRCLNGAYLSDVDEELLLALFGDAQDLSTALVSKSFDGKLVVSVETGTQISTVRARLGQANFSREIKRHYGNKCCFPGCNVTDPRFLVGAHIARWSDNEELRGNLGNGLCFCLMHDKAFELGIFSLDENFQVYINPREREAPSSFVPELLSYHGKEIRSADILPLDVALLEHWIRVDIDPFCD